MLSQVATWALSPIVIVLVPALPRCRGLRNVGLRRRVRRVLRAGGRVRHVATDGQGGRTGPLDRGPVRLQRGRDEDRARHRVLGAGADARRDPGLLQPDAPADRHRVRGDVLHQHQRDARQRAPRDGAHGQGVVLGRRHGLRHEHRRDPHPRRWCRSGRLPGVHELGRPIPVIGNGMALWPMVRSHLHLDRSVWKALVAGGFPLFLLLVFNQIYMTIDMPILNRIAGETTVGWYSLAWRWAGIPIFVASAVMASHYPSMSAHGADEGEQRVPPPREQRDQAHAAPGHPLRRRARGRRRRHDRPVVRPRVRERGEADADPGPAHPDLVDGHDLGHGAHHQRPAEPVPRRGRRRGGAQPDRDDLRDPRHGGRLRQRSHRRRARDARDRGVRDERRDRAPGPRGHGSGDGPLVPAVHDRRAVDLRRRADRRIGPAARSGPPGGRDLHRRIARPAHDLRRHGPSSREPGVHRLALGPSEEKRGRCAGRTEVGLLDEVIVNDGRDDPGHD